MNLIKKANLCGILTGTALMGIIGVGASNAHGEGSKNDGSYEIVRNKQCLKEVVIEKGRTLSDYADFIIKEDGEHYNDLLKIENDFLVRYIMEINNIKNPNEIVVGNKMKLPRYSLSPCFKSYGEMIRGANK